MVRLFFYSLLAGTGNLQVQPRAVGDGLLGKEVSLFIDLETRHLTVKIHL